MGNSSYSKCLVCKQQLVWIEEMSAYLPVPNCNRFNCPYLDNLEIDLEDNQYATN